MENPNLDMWPQLCYSGCVAVACGVKRLRNGCGASEQRGLPNARLHMPLPSCVNNDFKELFTGSMLL